jgi:sialic acid synthase SpsE
MIATGASTMPDVERAMKALQTKTDQIVLMQCNTNYTASGENFKYINLNVLKTYQAKYPGVVLGLSDHTHGHSTVLGAIALGAVVFEKHFTDDNGREGPDHKFAMNPQTWRDMVTAANELYFALGDGEKRIEANEIQTSLIQRRGLRFASDLPAGHKLTAQDLFPLRPLSTDGVPPYELHRFLGKKLNRSVKSDEYIRNNDIN